MPEAETSAPSRKLTKRNSALFVFIALLALAQGGCLLAVAGVAGGAAATGYFYCKGRVYRDFPVPFADVLRAVRVGLQDLNFAIFKEDVKDGKAFFITKTTNGKTVRIYLDCQTSPIPAEGLLTRISIRVSCFGDEAISVRIFDQVAWRLSHPGPVAPAPPGPSPIVAPPIQQNGFQTTEPKLAPSK